MSGVHDGMSALAKEAGEACQAEAATQTGHEALEIRWQHPHGLYRLSIVNFLLTLITFGIYHFWAKTEVRRRLWRAVVINGQPLEYTGRGIELFKGALIVGVMLTLLASIYYGAGLFLILGNLQDASPEAIDAAFIALTLLIYPFIAFLWGVGLHRAMRYRLRHTVWRGIRGTMGGSALRYGWMQLWTLVPVILTLGLLVPWRTIRLRNTLFSDMRFGSGHFRSEAKWIALLPAWLTLWGSAAFLALYGLVKVYLAIVTVNPYAHNASVMTLAGWMISLPRWVYWAVIAYVVYAFVYYEAKKLNVITNGAAYHDVWFSMDMTPLSVMAVIVRNYLLFLVSFGIFKPVMLANIAGHLVEYLKAHGTLNTSAIAQAPDEPGGAGEGLASYLDIDGI